MYYRAMDSPGKTKTITIDPRMFISRPFIKCPKCDKEEYGVLSIYGKTYSRRCRNCWHTESHSLPAITKKLIYLDQLVISEMMKALNPKVGRQVDPFWSLLFEKLDRLFKLQLIACPDSMTHVDESLASPFYAELKQMYEHLSDGVSFYDIETIYRFQISQNFKEWLGHKKVKPIESDNVMMGNPHEWMDRLRVSVDMFGNDPELPDKIRKDRDQASTRLNTVFTRWQSEQSRRFNDWYEEERAAFGPSILASYMRSVARYAAVLSGQVAPSIDNILGSNSTIIISQLKDDLKDTGLLEEHILPKIAEYLHSDHIKEIPYVRISAMLYASIARKAANSHGKMRSPSKGMVNDIETISAILPYCDAIFVDRECFTYLNEEPLRSKLGYKDKIFSMANKKQFLMYLESIENKASRSHMNKVKEVYGDGWETPYTTMYEK